MDALLLTAKGKSKVAAIRLWELETVAGMGWSEAAWIRLSLAERYRKVIAFKLSSWMQALESEEEVKRMRAKSGK